MLAEFGFELPSLMVQNLASAPKGQRRFSTRVCPESSQPKSEMHILKSQDREIHVSLSTPGRRFAAQRSRETHRVGSIANIVVVAQGSFRDVLIVDRLDLSRAS